MMKKIYKKIFPESFRYGVRNTLRKAGSIFLSGDDFFCPCCGKSFQKFLKKGNGLEVRKNAVCPNCGSLERTRLLFLYLKNETSIFETGKKILHIAPEYALKKHFKNHLHYLDVDLNPNLASHQMDITEIPKKNEEFDFIICSHILGHIPDEKKAIDEMFRVLKVGGKAFILTLQNHDEPTFENPNLTTEEERLTNYGEKDLLRLHGNNFKQRLFRENMEIEKIDYRQNFSSEIQQKYSLGDGKREMIFVGTKK